MEGFTMKNYTATGIVYGKNWGGGFGAYPARKIEAKTKAGLLSEAKKLLKSGGLDSGMGFESLKGAVLDITETENILINGKEFNRMETETEFIGDLSETEQDFLFECLIQG